MQQQFVLETSRNKIQMLNDYLKNCRPLRILESDSNTGSRIGGNPPFHVAPKEILICTKYFATLVLDNQAESEISIFNSFEFSVFSERSFLNNANIIFSKEHSSFLQFVLHDKSTRAQKKSKISSPLASKALSLMPEEADAPGWFDSNIYQGSKMGGYPLYQQNKSSIRGQGEGLLVEGFIHLFQFAFPSPPDAVISGNWPYGEYVVHVFVDDPKNPKDIRYGWG